MGKIHKQRRLEDCLEASPQDVPSKWPGLSTEAEPETKRKKKKKRKDVKLANGDVAEETKKKKKHRDEAAGETLEEDAGEAKAKKKRKKSSTEELEISGDDSKAKKKKKRAKEPELEGGVEPEAAKVRKKKRVKEEEHAPLIKSNEEPIVNDGDLLLNVVSVEPEPAKERLKVRSEAKSPEKWETIAIGSTVDAEGQNEKLEIGTLLRLRLAQFGRTPHWLNKKNAEAVSAAKKSYKHLIKGDIVVAFKNTNLHEIAGYGLKKKSEAQMLNDVF